MAARSQPRLVSMLRTAPRGGRVLTGQRVLLGRSDCGGQCGAQGGAGTRAASSPPAARRGGRDLCALLRTTRRLQDRRLRPATLPSNFGCSQLLRLRPALFWLGRRVRRATRARRECVSSTRTPASAAGAPELSRRAARPCSASTRLAADVGAAAQAACARAREWVGGVSASAGWRGLARAAAGPRASLCAVRGRAGGAGRSVRSVGRARHLRRPLLPPAPRYRALLQPRETLWCEIS